jgi:hypothetical protein
LQVHLPARRSASYHTSPSVGSSTNPNANATAAGNAASEPGAKSFTEGQARRRIDLAGRGDEGGRRVNVGVDFPRQRRRREPIGETDNGNVFGC